MTQAPHLVSAEKLAHLQAVVKLELKHVLETSQRLVLEDAQFTWLDRIEEHPLLAERLDAFVSRFGRLQDTLGDKLLRALELLQMLQTVTTNLCHYGRW